MSGLSDFAFWGICALVLMVGFTWGVGTVTAPHAGAQFGETPPAIEQPAQLK